MRRHELARIGFHFDSVIMEEAAQALEIETFVPLMLQNPSDGCTRLKRIVLIGDHNQLPPIVNNQALQRFSNMEQSMFARFVRLGVQPITLDMQGRTRASIARLFNWRYRQLGDMPHVHELAAFRLANPGFAYEYQWVDVGNFNGTHDVACMYGGSRRTRLAPSRSSCPGARCGDRVVDATAAFADALRRGRQAAARRSHYRTTTRISARPSTWWRSTCTCACLATRPSASPSCPHTTAKRT